MRTNVLLTITVVLLAVSASRAADDCILSDSASLGRCVKRMLLEARPRVSGKFDPLSLPSSDDGTFTIKDIVVRGLSAYSVPHLSITFLQPHLISVRASIAWPSISADLFARARKCKKILWKRRCISASATAHGTVGRTVGTLTTQLTVSLSPNGHITVLPSNTGVSINLSKITVNVRLRSKVGRFLNKIFGNPVSRIATHLTNKWWRKNKGKVEAKLRDALNKVVREYAAIQLAKLLKF